MANVNDRYGNVSVDIIIPTFKPGREFAQLIRGLALQRKKPNKIIICNTEEQYWDKEIDLSFAKSEVLHISAKEFDHGRTRDLGAGRSDADILLFMTQDAVPADEFLIEELIRPICEKKAEAAYARQLPREDASETEKYTRKFNYPEEGSIKQLSDVETCGVKTFFCSNVCAAYDAKLYRELGGFPYPVVLNEDMLFAGKLIHAGHRIAYVPKAQVIHSHSYGTLQQFRRNFDIGASQADNDWLFGNVPSESEGKKLVKQTVKHLKEQHQTGAIVPMLWQSGWKYLGYSLGKRYRKLPKKLVMKCSMNPDYWKEREKNDR